MKRNIIIIENGVVFVPASNNIWMTVHEISGLFECFVSAVGSNIRSILKTGVLNESDVCGTYHYQNGSSVEQYNLEMITALAFRIKSYRTEIFRNWLFRRMTATDKVSVVWKVPLFGTMLN